jgi:hypothetical protein
MSEHAPHRPIFTITLRPEKSCSDPVKALRRLLKIALRTFGLKCISVEQVRR